ncbi:MAG: hypothetical protein SWH54_04930 [Thermodesulfobacteriota bacterium]|nr:hypothetical protein [Thermodesulfobacteriota bacterium]
MNRHQIWYRAFNDPLGRRFGKIKMMVTDMSKAAVFLGFAIFLQACDSLTTTKEIKNQPVVKEVSAKQLAKPPVDLSAPDKTETATFALG